MNDDRYYRDGDLWDQGPVDDDIPWFNSSGSQNPGGQPTGQTGGGQARPEQQPRRTQSQPRSTQPRPRSGGGGGNNRRPRKKRRSVARTVLTILILVLVGVIVGSLLYVYNILGKMHYEPVESTTTSQKDSVKKVDKLTNILLVGEDAREGQNGQRSDSIILCTINPDTHEAILTSFMRDMYVPIPGHKKNRINTAFSQGGIALLEETISTNFDVYIDGYVAIDFAGFIQAIASLGDMQFDLTEEEAKYMNKHPEYGSEIDWTTDVWNLHPGVNTLTPEQVLAYSRMRHVGNSDWERTERQRKVLMTAYQQVKNASLTDLLSLLNQVAPCITTDIKSADLLSYVYMAAGDGIQNIESHRIPADGTYSLKNISGMEVLVPDLQMNADILKEYINNERSNGDEETGEETSKESEVPVE